MRPPDQRADEPYESRDQELGDALRSWTQANASLLSIALEGLLDSAGMDPTWLLRMSSESLDAEVCLFYGPRVDVAAFLPKQPADRMFVGSEDGVTQQRLVEILDELVRVNGGEVMPTRLRSPQL
ncbi:hypothetical protein [Paractinoplanes ferrugineus]|nr:hypothetical protein [Actinoplanes ferrugineus]